MTSLHALATAPELREGKGVTVQALTASFRWGMGAGTCTILALTISVYLQWQPQFQLPAWPRQKVIVVCKVYVFTCKHGFVPAKYNELLSIT